MLLTLSPKRVLPYFMPIVSLGIFLAFWQALSLYFPPALLPTPAMVYHEAVAMLEEPLAGYSLWEHIFFSMRRVLSAYALAIVTGIPLGIYMGWNRTFDKIVSPVFELLRPIPPIAWIPLAILWLGIGEGPKILICYIGAFVILVLNSYTGMRYTDPELIEVARTYGATKRQQLINVAIPASLPSVFAGVQNALSNAWMCVLAAELVGAREGVGFIIIQGSDMDNPSMVIVGMVIIGLAGLSFAGMLRIIERWLCPWKQTLK